ncbi:hypothetical protein PCANC_24959 [Puccinia coronata f. sp. avenae]|uniref:AMP-activated protein kinase glycogen-binding domain-containing protein n=2 Tax=Puccinia coronata f. sp. avenae TaxID=200324 RepID=A0A2N5S8Q7_9BASI|nr:hypothetical protein PCANC_24959 [Puccinia coronata f. sp. avenae]PLW37479.1 hypothetical protein PCASD_10688 [Puccinia coronata f. sp. avenae]
MAEQRGGKYLHHFRWESSVPDRVSIKGSFDQWQSPLELEKHPSGKFSAPIHLDYGSKVSYKYVVDGTWRHNPNEPTETDSNGNVNNILQVPQHPSFSVDPDKESAQTLLPHPTQGTSSQVVAEEPPSVLSPAAADPSKTPEPVEPVTSTDMSIAFPSASTDDVPELTQRPKPPLNAQRTLSLFSPVGRFSRASHRTQSLATAPGTPTEKASPAGASVSNVVSAMAGVAATAIPAAILAVTGKDITHPKQADSPDAPSPADDKTSSPTAGAAAAAEQSNSASQSPANDSEQPSQTDVSPPAAAVSDLPPQPTDKTTPPVPEPLAAMPVNDATENTEPQPDQPTHPVATHQLLPSSDVEKPVEPEATALQPPPQPAIAPTVAPQATSLAADPLVDSAAVSSASTPQKPPPEIVTPSDLPREGETAKLSPTPPLNAESPPKVSFSDEESSATPQARLGSVDASGSSSAAAAPQVKISPQATASGPASPNRTPADSLGPKSKTGEFARKTSGWRYSVGSIRSRRASGEHERRSVSDTPPPAAAANGHPLDPAAMDLHESSSPKSKRRSGLFQKIKSALSPHKKSDYSSSHGGHSKHNSLSRTTTINRD